VPDQPDEDGLVPPIKVMRRRLNGVYSAEGLAGPTRRYVLIVAMLVGLASLPTLAAITAGSNELDDGRPGAMDVPFIPPASPGPVRVRPVPSAGTDGPQDGTVPGSSGTAQGQAQKRKTKPRPGAPVKDDKGYAQSALGGLSGSSGSLNSGGSSSPSGDGAESWRPGSSSGGGSSGSGSSDSSGAGSSGSGSPGAGSSGAGSSAGGPAPVRLPVMPAVPSVPMPMPVPMPVPAPAPAPAPGKPQQPSDSVGDGGSDSQDDSPDDGRDDSSGSHWSGGGSSGDHWSGGDGYDDAGSGDDVPEPPAKPVHPPWCMDRSDCSARRAHHHRPRHQDCDDRGHAHGRRSAGREDDDRDRAKVRRTSGGDRDRSANDSSDERDQPAETSSIRTAKAARSDSRRRPEVTERPQNVRPARPADRTHNSNRYQPSAADRGEGTQTTTATRAYRGSHRAERMHRVDDHTGAHHRSSRMGRHHAEPRQDSQDHQQNRW